MLELIKPYITEIITFVAGAGAWGYERNKRKAAYNKTIMELYQEALDDLKKRYDAHLRELEERYDKRFKELELRYNKLKQSFEDYKKKH